MKKILLVIISAILCFSIIPTAYSAPFPIQYDWVGERLIATGNGDFFDQEFEFINNTNSVWTDFHFRLEGGGLFIDDPSGGHDGSAYEGPGTYLMGDPVVSNTLDVFDLSINSGTSFVASIDLDNFEFGLPWDLYATPTINGGPPTVPEPSTIILFGFGLLGLSRVCRKKK